MRRLFLPLSIRAAVVSAACSDEPRTPGSRGFTAVHDLHGGIRAWSTSGLPVER